jgi:peptidoglycan/LPS O-acetylase OafA/YrhL
MRKVFFPNLNGLRFLAAFMVILYHVEQTKDIFNLPNYWHNPTIYILGKLGVILFFVLSGFLITYLLLEEKNVTGDISVKNFYVRRILRIWPLYFLITGLAMFVFPNIPFFQMPELSEAIETRFWWRVLFFALILPNVVLFALGIVPFAAQSWSIGVEEQFYIAWPILVKKSKNILKMLLGVIIFYLVLKILFYFLHDHFGNKHTERIKNIWDHFAIDCMAYGGILAYFLFHKREDILNFLFSKPVQILSYGWVIICLGLGFHAGLFHYEFYAIPFGIIILNLAGNPGSLIHMENGVFDYLGKISYGMYMYHQIAIVICLRLMGMNVFSNLLLLVGSLVLTVIISSISYEFFEIRLLKYKSKFSSIISGDEARKG